MRSIRGGLLLLALVDILVAANLVSDAFVWFNIDRLVISKSISKTLPTQYPIQDLGTNEARLKQNGHK